ncbi:MerR family transcriptional regulator [Paractinoplanes hotanensis]|uniref:MerR family transcriptional regulator n=1 Tax=Paractinoplanes hotanensis TaxID=2906497 RepID=A0ABT0Y903_9ACTN|nr:MerR family transcriptional regulator [Actinoplanes hotanensis]MCM4082521.1 MerR family transcriptional regulator [Actinoplanes hotanensis]
MGLLTIGAFARAAGLTPKALRLYDELGVLAPAAVDAESGYRFYDPSQVAHARLVAQLREIGMPLAEIREVCALPPAEAADAVAGFWQQVSADTAARARLTSALVEHLSGKDTTMSDYRFAAGIDPGVGRDTNEDQAYAGEHLVAVADGTRGPFGAAAAAAAIEALKPLELTAGPGAELLTALASAVTAADRTVRGLSPDDEPVTTLTAVLRRGSQLALVHIGDTRAYLLRHGGLSLLTQDHTWVQTQVEQGKLSASEAAGHPQRALLVRALGWGEGVEADLALRTALPGDRYLLCSDGLSAVVPRDTLRAVLTSAQSPDEAVGQLIAAAREAGAPDNIACAAYFSTA